MLFMEPDRLKNLYHKQYIQQYDYRRKTSVYAPLYVLADPIISPHIRK